MTIYNMNFFHLPFIVDDDRETIAPLFDKSMIQKIPHGRKTFHLKILGKQPTSILQINYIADYISTILNDDSLEWEFVESKFSKSNEMLGVLLISDRNEFGVENDDLEFRQVTHLSSNLFDYYLSQVVQHNLTSEEYHRCLDRLEWRTRYNEDNSHLLKHLLSLHNRIQEDVHQQVGFNMTIDSLQTEIIGVDGELRTSLISLLEDNNFSSARQVVLLLELNYLFSLFLNGLLNFDFCDFTNKVKSLLVSLDKENITKIILPYLGSVNLYDADYYPY